MKTWTEEERLRAMTYGLCRTCGEPRLAQITVTHEDDETIYTHVLTCPNGHSQ